MMDETRTVHISGNQYEMGRECDICGESFVVENIHSIRTICPECCERLRKILYPEKPVR